MPWKNVECHPNVRNSLLRTIQKGMLSGTHILYGPPGAGQISVARAIAKSLLCKNEDGDFCDQCSNCKRIEGKSYSDVFELHPNEDWADEKRKGRDYSIDHMRIVQKNAQSQPYEGKLKIFILTDAERLRVESANCLLKILEEPYEHTLFILLTANITRILPTILSRCRKVRLPQMPMNAVSQTLTKEITPEQAVTLARVSGGFPERARQMHQEGYLEMRNEVFEEIKKIRHDPSCIYNMSEQWNKKKELLDIRLTILASIMRDGLILSAQSQKMVNNSDIEQSLLKLWEGIPIDNLIIALEKLIDAQENLDRYVNSALILSEILVLAFAHKQVNR